ncbi:chitin deacetylase 1-like [Pollicipes pollicipes]|uniref:chitin deacetylase 1-like n=1 Tax=Pollicipes pollicipes TaxID=41117 RepID=UPI001884FE00|nr:chitin deacetylase 1-like [Pollicipes pollicipes]
MRAVACILVLLACAAHANRVKRQDDEQTEEDTIKAICKGKGPGEWFRLNPGPAHCKEVVQCTSAGLQQIRCPQGLVFDLVQQTCDWKAAVPNCDLTERPKLPKPLLVTDEPLCEGDSLACAEGTCIARELFCDGNSDCNDGSDENACDMGSDPNRAPPCDVEKCQLPSCFCSEDGTVIPGNLLPEDVPQMVMLTFNGAINNNNIELFNELFSNERVNPNGCPIKGTFFVSHKYTNYTAVQDFHNRGHEIAVFSITQNDAANFWTNASRTDWSNEMAGQRFIIEKFAAISDESVVGMRTPYLRVGGNNQFFMMFEQKFLYDSTITAPLSDIPIWPYTLLNQMPHACHGNAQKCPTRAFPVWEMVMNELDRREDPSVDDDLPGCAQVDSCSNIRTGEQFYRFLDHNFDRHYLTNRAPLSLNFHSAWLKKEENLDYLLLWIEEIQRAFPDTYFVTMTQVIEWMQNTPSSAETKDFDLWLSKCDEPVGFPCIKPGGNNCALHAEEVQGTFNMQTCQRCPTNFPWLSDPTGEGFL